MGIPASEIATYTTIESRSQRIRVAIGSRKMLLVIDDAWQIEDALALKVGGPNCAHLLTTRLPELAWYFAQERAKLVYELNESESLALLSEFVPKLVIAHQKEARDLVNAVGGLPLALILMGRYLQKSLRFDQHSRLAILWMNLANNQGARPGVCILRVFKKIFSRIKSVVVEYRRWVISCYFSVNFTQKAG